MEAKKECIIDKCKKKPHRRSLCQSCYQSAYRLVGSGRATWEELESVGLCTGGVELTPFMEAFRKQGGGK